MAGQGQRAGAAGRKKRPRTVQVAAHLRELLLGRHIGPGERIPSRDELAATLGVSRMSVHRGVGILVDAGLLVADGARGTFVSDHPPHRFRYAVAFGLTPEEIVRSPHLSALYRAAGNPPGLGPCALVRFVPPQPDGGRNPAVSDIPEQARAGLLAGVLSLRGARMLPAQGLQEVAGRIPVAVMTPAPGAVPVAAVVAPDRASFVRRALDLVVEARRTRVAFLWYQEPRGADEVVEREAALRGLRCPPFWRHYFSDPSDIAVAHVVHLLMEGSRARRPQALVVADDMLTGVVFRKLWEIGLGSGSDPLVLSLANYPQVPAPELPVRWLGFDACEWLRLCVDTLHGWYPGSPCLHVNLPARLAEEIPGERRFARDEVLLF